MYTIGLRASLQRVLAGGSTTESDNNESIPENTTDLILIDGHTTDTSELAEIRSRFPQAELVYIIDGHAPSHLINFARTWRTQLLPLRELPVFLREREKKTDQPILTFWGVLPGLGTTTTALAVATHLQTEYDLSVGVFGLNAYDAGSWMVHNPSYYLDDFKSYLSTRQLPPQKLRDSMNELPSGVKYLLGNRNQALALQYKMDDIAYLIEQASQAFQVVILDAGSILNTATSIQAFNKATIHYAVITDRLYVQQHFQNQVQHILKPLNIDVEKFLLIGNKMEHPNARTLTTFAKAVRAQPLASIGDMKALATYAEQRPDPIREMLNDKKYRQAIDSITDGISAIHQFQKVSNARGGLR